MIDRHIECEIFKQDYRLVPCYPFIVITNLVNGRSLNHDQNSMSNPPPPYQIWLHPSLQSDMSLNFSKG
jgi:hypothetical protein